MRGRWQFFPSGLIVFVTWYLVAYAITADTFAGVLSALGSGLIAAMIGLVAGALTGAVAHAIDLAATHRGVRAGDARDGARVSIGKLPGVVPGSRTAAAPIAPGPARPGPMPEPVPASAPAADPAAAGQPAVPSAAPTSSPLHPAEPGWLAAESAAFAREHAGVRVTPNGHGGATVGAIDRAGHPADFAAFLALVTTLAGESVDVSAVAVTQDADGLPVTVTFPVSGDEPENTKE